MANKVTVNGANLSGVNMTVGANGLTPGAPDAITGVNVTINGVQVTNAMVSLSTREQIWPMLTTPSGQAEVSDAHELEVGVKFKTAVDGFILAIRFFKAQSNPGPHVVTLWDASTKKLIQSAMVSGETASGWQTQNFGTAIPVKANTTYIASYHMMKGNYWVARDAAGLVSGIRSGNLYAFGDAEAGGNGVYAYGPQNTFPDKTYHQSNYWVDVVFSQIAPGTVVVVPPVPPDPIPPNPVPGPTLKMATVVSSGVSGMVKYGFNQHAWSYARSKEMYNWVGSKVFRINITYARYISEPWPPTTGFNSVSLAAVKDGCADGKDCVFALTNPGYPVTDTPKWGDFCRDVAAWVGVNGLNDKVILENGNEPNFNIITAQQFYDALKVGHTGMKAGNPNARMAAPVINASYVGNAVNFVNNLAKIPGFYDLFEYGDFHPYYQTPENSWKTDLNAFITRLGDPGAAIGKDKEFIASEVGWTNAIGVLTDKTGENRGGTGTTTTQPEGPAGDYYSRYVPITRATKKLRYITFYALKDENPGDPTFTNGQAHFGVYKETVLEPKPAAMVCRDLIPLCQQAQEAVFAHRGASAAGQEYENADWFVKLKLALTGQPQTNALVAWVASAAPPRDTKLVVRSQSVGKATWWVAGDSARTSSPIGIGDSVITVPLGHRSIIITTDVPADFPEIVNPKG